MIDVTPPPGLPLDQQPIWADTITRLNQAGQLARADPAHVAAYVAAVHQHRQATSLVNRTAVLLDRAGQPVANPALAVAERAERRVAHLARTLGLTTRAAAPGLGKERSPGEQGRWCEEHRRWECQGHKHGGAQCHQVRRVGLATCKNHQGRGGEVKHLAAVAQRDYPLAVEEEDIHPAEALLWRVRYLAAVLRSIDAQVAALRADEVGWGLEREQESTGGEFPGTTTTYGARLNVWIAYQAQTDRALQNAASAALQAAAEERLVRMAEAQGARAFAAYQKGLSMLGLSEAQWEAAREAMPRVLQELVT